MAAGCGSSDSAAPAKKKGEGKPAAKASPDLSAPMPSAPPTDPKAEAKRLYEERMARAREAAEAAERAKYGTGETERPPGQAPGEEPRAPAAKPGEKPAAGPPAEAEGPGPAAEEPKPAGGDAEDAAEVAKEVAALSEFEAGFKADLAKYRFAPCAERAKEFREGLKTATARTACGALLLRLQTMGDVFGKMVARLEPGRKIELGPNMTVEVEKADADGVAIKIGQAKTLKKWSEFDKKVVLSLFDWEDMEAPDRFGVASFAALCSMPEEVERNLLLCVQEDAAWAGRASALLVRCRGLDAATVLIPYKGMWVTTDEKKFIDQGKEKHQGRWMTPDEIMKAKGYVRHEGRWLTKEEYDEETKEARALEELAAKLAPKGLIDKAGADSEDLDWSKARVFQYPKGNYQIKANLSMDAVKDAAYIMEVLNYNFRKVFKVRKTMPKFPVSIAKNQQEYDTILGGGGLGKCSGSDMSTFYQPPNTVMVLMHEGTHQFIFKAAPCCPTWLHEALATYFECSKFVVNPKTKQVDLATGLLNKFRLGPIQEEFKNGTATPLREQIKENIGGLQMYHQGWALAYYLINAEGGKYAPRLFWYLDKFAGKGGTGVKKGTTEDRQVMRFMQALGIYDLDEFEKKWKEYILGLKMENAEEFRSGHQ
jgi:hypothetical protein